jgi:hypothetical protein
MWVKFHQVAVPTVNQVTALRKKVADIHAATVVPYIPYLAFGI